MCDYSIVAFRRATLLLPLLLLCGCGGGGGGSAPRTDALEILARDGLVFTLEPNVPNSPMGSQMGLWLNVTNDRLTTRTLELRPRGDQQGGRTCVGTISYEDGVGNRSVVYELARNDAISVQLQAGETIALAEFLWDNIRQDNGQTASPGYYNLAIVLDNLYVDGKKPADWPTFEVRAERRVNFIKNEPWVAPRELLRAEGLIISIGTDKPVYQKGEPIPIWFHIRNEGLQTRTLEARGAIYSSASSGASRTGRPNLGLTSRGDGPPTYGGGFMCYTPDGQDYVRAWGFSSSATLTKDIAPGETIRFVESVWDQVNSDGTPARVGYYDAYIILANLYVDGRNLGNAPGFMVDVSAPIRIVE